MHILCESCRNAMPFTGCDQCLECVCDELIANPEELFSLRRIHRGTEWIKQVNAQIERELARRVPAGAQRDLGSMSMLDLVAGITNAAARIERVKVQS